jgi:two-component system, NtrC family, sensor histidine kinase PilS
VFVHDETSRSLWLAALYRLFAASFLVWLGTLAPGDPGFVPAAPVPYLFIAATYLVFALVLVLVVLVRNPGHEPNGLSEYKAIGGALLDILAIILILLTAGGVQTGLGLLLIPAVAATATITGGRTSLFIAAAATLMILLTELLIGPALPWRFDPGPTQAGLLGATLFIAVVLTSSLAQRAGSSEARVAHQEMTLASLSELNAQIIARMGAGVIALDPQGTVLSVNEAARRLLPPRTGSTIGELSPQLAAIVANWQKNSGRSEVHVLPGDAEQTELEVRVTPLGMFGEQGALLLVDDAAETKRRSHAAKLQAIGRLTASIAHEIRNPIGAISHSAQLLAESPNLDAADQRLLDIIQKQSRRVDGVIRNVLGLSRGGAPQREIFRLKERLERFAEDFCSAMQIPRDALHISIHPEDSEVQFDPSQLHQVLWNLCMNARRHGGHDQADSGPVILRGGAGQIRRSVTLDVIDDGPGILTEDRDGLFEPFASRSPGGTGLGLFISRLLCENNGAALEYVQQPRGGCFRILFAPTDSLVARSNLKETPVLADNPQ